MKTSLKIIINRFNVISKLENEESDEITSLFSSSGLGITMGEESIGMLFEPNPAQGALVGFLERLPDYVVFAIMALMYSGRDNIKDVNDYWSNELQVTFPNVERAINSIREKHPRMKYINKGIEHLGQDKLEEFLQNIKNTIGEK